MIVCYTSKGWQVITQRAHGLLAGQICARWKPSNQPARWVDTLIATTEHDDVFNEFERNPLVDAQGAPINFNMTSFDYEASNRLVDMSLTKSRYIALLISRHIAFTHGKDADAKDFLHALKKKEKQWIKDAGTTRDDIDQAYELLEFCDAFSLLICQEQIPPENRKIEISNGPDGQVYTFYQLEEMLVVEPWPFEVDQFQINYEIRHITQLKFNDDNAFRNALKAAQVNTTNMIISKAK